MKNDVFISYAWEDKKDFVDLLANSLKENGLLVWYDDFVLKIGNSIAKSINDGLNESVFGIVVLSPNYFKKKWPQIELATLIAKERSNESRILPIWHNIDKEYIEENYPILLDRVASRSSQGIDCITQEILEKVKPRMAEYKLKFLHEIAESAAIIRGIFKEKINECKKLGTPNDVIISLLFETLSEFENIILKTSEAGNISEIESIKKKVKSLFKKAIGYCVKCRKKRGDMMITKEVKMKGKGGPRRALAGKCAVCGTGMYRILRKA